MGIFNNPPVPHHTYGHWTSQDQKDFEKLIQDMSARDHEAKIKAFMAYPEDIREAVLAHFKQLAIQEAIDTIQNSGSHYMLSDVEQELLNKAYKHGIRTHHHDEYRRNSDIYEELCKINADRAAQEILLNDKK